MTLNVIDYIEFPAKDAGEVAACKAFYGAAFGWTYTDWAPTYIDTHASGIGSGFDGNASERVRAPLAVVHVADLEAAQAAVVASGGRVCREIFAFPGGRRFHFIDPAGNELAAWCET